MSGLGLLIEANGRRRGARSIMAPGPGALRRDRVTREAHPGFRGAGGGVRGVRPSDPCPMADYGFLRWRLVAAMAGIAHQPVLTMTSLQMITLTSLIDDAKCYELIRHYRWPDTLSA